MGTLRPTAGRGQGGRVNDGAVVLEDVSRDFVRRTNPFAPPVVVPAVRGVSLSIERGEAFGIVGESGSGKTTLARLMAGLIAPTSGRVRVEGRDPSRLRPEERLEFRRRLQVVFQDAAGALDPRQTVRQALEEVARVHGPGVPGDSASILNLVGLRPEDAEKRPSALSGGQCQRAVIARALVLRPVILIADEPVSHLDVSTQAQVTALLSDLRARLGLTLVMIAHDLGVVRLVVDRVAVVLGGRVVEAAPTESVLAHPLHPYTKRLLDSAPRPCGERPEMEEAGPVPRRPGEGCPFWPSCTEALAECRRQTPDLRAVAGEPRQVRCVRA